MAKGKKRKLGAGDVATNRQAGFRYELLDKLECGIVLAGTEVKALRDGGVVIKDGYASIDGGELWLHNVHIPPYAPAARENHEPERVRKLLVHRREIDRLEAQVAERGFTLVPTRVYFKDGRARSRSRSAAARTASTSATRSRSATPSATWPASCATPSDRARAATARSPASASGGSDRRCSTSGNPSSGWSAGVGKA